MANKQGVIDAFNKAKAAGHIDTIQAVEKQYGIPSGMMVGLAAQESMFNPEAVSRGGAVGMFQFMPKTAGRFKIDPLNVSQSADAAGRYLSILYKQFGSWKGAASAYNWGEGNYGKWLKGKRKMNSETRDYYPNITKMRKILQGELKQSAIEGVNNEPLITPNIPSVGAGSIPNAPATVNNGAGNVDQLVPQQMPQVQQMPQIPQMPQIAPQAMPDIQMPQMPQVAPQTMPDIQTPQMPDIQMPQMQEMVEMPQIVPQEMPDIQMPAGAIPVSAPYGDVVVAPETRQEATLMNQLQGKDEGLIPHIPELLNITKMSGRLLSSSTKFDKLLMEALEAM